MNEQNSQVSELTVQSDISGTTQTAVLQSQPGESGDAALSNTVSAKADSKTSSQSAEKKQQTRNGKKVGKKKRRPLSTGRMIANLLIKLGVIALVIWLALTFVLSVNIHYGNNMFPAVRDGDLVVGFRMQRPYINAAVVYEHDGEVRVGRVIGLPGNEIRISDLGEITVNGVIPSEEVFYPTLRAESSDVTYPYTVEEGKVFILNDFRSDTDDSRTFGAVDMNDVKGPLLITLRRRGF